MKHIIKILQENWLTKQSNLAQELDNLVVNGRNMGSDKVAEMLIKLEEKYQEEYAAYEGDSYGVIDAINASIPYGAHWLKDIYDSIHPKVRYEGRTLISKLLRESLIKEDITDEQDFYEIMDEATREAFMMIKGKNYNLDMRKINPNMYKKSLEEFVKFRSFPRFPTKYFRCLESFLIFFTKKIGYLKNY